MNYPVVVILARPQSARERGEGKIKKSIKNLEEDKKVTVTMAISIDNLRVGLKYHLKNYSEIVDFEVLEKTADNDFKIKDLNTLEIYQFQEFIKYGIAKDYELEEIGSGK